VPGETFSFQELIQAQASGDALALQAKGLKVFRLHLQDRTESIAELLKAFD